MANVRAVYFSVRGKMQNVRDKIVIVCAFNFHAWGKIVKCKSILLPYVRGNLKGILFLY